MAKKRQKRDVLESANRRISRLLIDHVTNDDLARAGACDDGVEAVQKRLGLANETAVRVCYVLPRLEDDEVPFLLKASGRAGYGSGDGE